MANLPGILDWPTRFHAGLGERYGPRRRWVWWALLALAIVIPLWLWLGPGPFDGKLLRKVAKRAAVPFEGRAALAVWWDCWFRPGEAGPDGTWQWKVLPAWMYGVTGRWWGLLGCWFGVIGLGLTTRWWLVRGYELAPPLHAGLTRVPRWAWISMTVAMLVALPARLPKMGHSFWHDEVFAAQEYILGDWERNEAGAWRFEPKPWEATSSGDRLVNNHMLYSVLARACLEGWRLGGRHTAQEWVEWPLRLPSLLAGLGTIWLASWMLARRGRPLGGVLCAWILALHPWHAYWSADARGYALMLFFVVLLVSRLLRCFEAGGLGRWVVFGLVEAALLLTYPPTVYLMVVVNLFAPVGIWIGRKKLARWRGLRRWAVGNLVGAMLTVVFLAPHVPQFRAYFAAQEQEQAGGGRWASMGGMGAGWWADFGSHLLLGQRRASEERFAVGSAAAGLLPAREFIEVPHHASSLALLRERGPLFRGLLSLSKWGGLLLLGLGLVSAARQGWRTLGGLLLPLAGCGLFWLGTVVGGGYIWVWYLLPGMITGVWLVALGPEALSRQHRVWLAVPALLLVAAWAWLGHPQREVQAWHDRMPLRQAVAAVRGGAPLVPADVDPRVTLLTLGTANARVPSYDPTVRVIERQKDTLERDGADATDLTAIARGFEGRGRRVFVLFCAPQLLAQEYPLAWTQLRGPDWHEVAQFPGTEAQWSYRVYRFTPRRENAGGRPPPAGGPRRDRGDAPGGGGAPRRIEPALPVSSPRGWQPSR